MAFNLDFNYFNNIPIDLTTPKLAPKRRSSFFNIVVKEKEDKSLKKAEYMKELKKEKKDWREAIQVQLNSIRALNKLIEEKVSYDSSIMSQERKDYLNQRVDVEEYIWQSEDFANRVLLYVTEKEMLQKQLSFCQDQLNDRIIESTIKNLSGQKSD